MVDRGRGGSFDAGEERREDGVVVWLGGVLGIAEMEGSEECTRSEVGYWVGLVGGKVADCEVPGNDLVTSPPHYLRSTYMREKGSVFFSKKSIVFRLALLRMLAYRIAFI